jgi:glycosyltransferase involved in cell wall biosynthesis
VVPLAIALQPEVPDAIHGDPLHVMYIGQLYAGQGVEDLLEAVARVNGVVATIVGGTPSEVSHLRAALPAAALERVRFTGFVAPAEIPALAREAHVFVAPFRAERRMPFVAHTKLAEYAALRRPVVAPDLPIVHEHFPHGGVRCYRPNDVASLAAALSALRDLGRWKECVAALPTARVTRWGERARNYLALLETVRKATANQ